MSKKKLRGLLRDARRECRGWKQRAKRQQELIAELRLQLDLSIEADPARHGMVKPVGIHYATPPEQAEADEPVRILRIRQCALIHPHEHHAWDWAPALGDPTTFFCEGLA